MCQEFPGDRLQLRNVRFSIERRRGEEFHQPDFGPAYLQTYTPLSQIL